MARQIIDTVTPPIGDPAPTAFNKCNLNFAELYPLATGALQKTGGVLSGDLSIQKNVIVSSYLSPNGQVGYRMLVNISNEVDGGYTIQRLAAGAWSDCVKVNNDKTTVFSGGVHRPGIQNAECFRVVNIGAGEQGIGGAFGSWSSNRTPALQVDAQSRTDAYMALRATNWGVAHLFALDIYQGTTAEVATANFHFPGKENAHRFFANGNAAFAGTLTQNSDYRIKDDVTTIDPEDAARALRQVRPVEYTDIQNGYPGPRRAGFIAHEFQDALPLLVDGEKDAIQTVEVAEGDTTPYLPGTEPEGYIPPSMKMRAVPKLQGVNYAGSTVYLTAGWHEHDARIERLEAALSSALDRIAALESAA